MNEITNTVADIVQIDHTEYGLDASEAHQVQAAFEPMLQKMVELREEYDRVTSLPISEETCAEAKKLRLKYVSIRTSVDKIHKKAKSYYRAGGLFVDGWKNAQKFASEGIEESLREIEEHYERQEQARIAQLEEERAAMLEPYGGPVPGLKLGELEEDAWENFYTGAKARHEAKVKAEQEAEARRVAEAEAEAKRIREQAEENKRLKAQADEREAELEAERKKVQAIEAERKRLEDAAAAKLKAEQEAEAREAEAEGQKTEQERFADFVDAVLEVTDRFSFEEEQFVKAHAWFARNAESIKAKIHPVTEGVAA